MPIRKLLCTLLKRGGYETVDFDNGAESLEWLGSNKAKAVLMDILLPDINGTELIQSVRALEQHKETVIVAVTGFAASHDREKFSELGFNGYLSKPINTTTFIEDIEAIIK